MKKVIICVSNDLENDQRVNRTALTLFESGYEVLVVGRKLSRSKQFSRAYSIFRFNMVFKKSMFFYAEYNIRLFFFLLFKHTDIVFSNDIDTLPACWLAARTRGRKLVFDSHELFSEVPELTNRLAVKKFWIKMENLLIPRIDVGITVCQPIADIYNQKYGINFHVIRNVPLKKTEIRSSREFTHQILYQGAVNKGRGIELLIQSLQFFKEANLVIAGMGDEYLKMQDLVRELGLTDRITFLGHVPYDLLHKITRQAAVGVSLEEDMGLNYRFALPNKIFDYIQSGVPVVVSNLPVMAGLVNNFQVGEVLFERTPEMLAQTLRRVIENRNNQNYEHNLKIASETLNWDNEKQKFLSIFGSF